MRQSGGLVGIGDLGALESAAHRVILMAEGEIVEQGPPDQVFEHPQHDRTRAFLSHIL